MKCAVSEQVHNHFRKYEVEYLQFAFRWMNNLLMRELPLRCTIRLWDTYQVCTALPAWLVTVTCVPVGTGGAEGNKALWPQGVYSQLGGSAVSGGLFSSQAAGVHPEFCCPQSEPEGFSHFHLYVCAAFLIKWRKEILDEEDFQVRP